MIVEYTQKGLIKREVYAPTLTQPHLDKSKHNLRFVSKNMSDEEFNDWTVVALYYAIYHACLALIAKKGYVTKDHGATLLLLIKEYGITEEEVKLINDLHITKDDAEFYSNLKEKRRQASYATNTLFRTKKVKELREQTLLFINKAEEMLAQK